MMCGVAWDFSQDGHAIGPEALTEFEPAFAKQVHYFVDQFQLAWHTNQAHFWWAIYPGSVESLAPYTWASKPEQLGKGFLPLVRGAILEAVRVDKGLDR